MRTRLFTAAILATVTLSASAEASEHTLVLKDHRFTPSELTVAAGEKIVLTVKNEDDTPAEFESHSLKREKIIKGKSQAVIKVGPLAAGRYEFEDEFHEKTAQGVLIVK